MSTDKPFRALKDESCASLNEALEKARAFYAPLGFTNFRLIDEGDDWRITATTPGGRGGRNVAFVDFSYEEDSEDNIAGYESARPEGTEGDI